MDIYGYKNLAMLNLKNPVLMYDVDNNKIIVSNKVSFGKVDFKYFFCYKDNKTVRPLYMKLLKIRAYRKKFDEKIYAFFDKK